MGFQILNSESKTKTNNTSEFSLIRLLELCTVMILEMSVLPISSLAVCLFNSSWAFREADSTLSWSSPYFDIETGRIN
jgi:hypothetical protein